MVNNKKLGAFELTTADEQRLIAAKNMREAILYAVSIMDYHYDDIENMRFLGIIEIDPS